MILKINDERNFFLFQDIVHWFIEALEDRRLHILHYKHEKSSASYYAYESWRDVLNEKLCKAPLTKHAEDIIAIHTPWMVTTNIAITTAQKGRGKHCIPEDELEYVEKYEPYFLIEHQDNYETYLVHLEGEIKDVFLEILDCYRTLARMEKDEIKGLLLRYYDISSEEIEEELSVIVPCYYADVEWINTYEVMEE